MSSELAAEKLPLELSEACEDDLQRFVPLMEDEVGGVGRGAATGAFGASSDKVCSFGRLSIELLEYEVGEVLY